MTGNTFQVTSRAPSARQDGAVVVTPPKGPAFDLTAGEARELQHGLLNAVVALERADRATVAKAKTAEVRKLRQGAEK